MEDNGKLLEDSLLVIWNDRDADRRLQLMKKIYAEDIVFYEANESPSTNGHQAINDLISELQKQWPLEFKFELSQPLKVNHQIQHISWTLGAPGERPAASGMDIAIVEDDRIKELHLFLDVAPKV